MEKVYTLKLNNKTYKVTKEHNEDGYTYFIDVATGNVIHAVRMTNGDVIYAVQQIKGVTKMKIKPEHLAVLKEGIDKVLKKYPNITKDYEQGEFARADKVKDLQKRFCFDLMFGAGLNSFVCDTLYTYMNSDHLYTALKVICPKVVMKYRKAA